MAAEGTMIERVAKAINAVLAISCGTDGDVNSDDWTATGGTIHLDKLARAAIEAIGEPTQAMIRAGARNLEGQFAEDRADQLWADMIEAALSVTKAPA